MKIAVGSDHGGFCLKRDIILCIRKLRHVAIDVGAHDDRPSDYPDFAAAVADRIVKGDAARGILICGSGVGASIAANKVRGVRAAVCHDTFSARQGVEDDSMNVLCLGARVVGPRLAEEVVREFLAARFSNVPRHRRRLQKVLAMEEDLRK